MENKTTVTASLILVLFALSGCEVVGTIFKTGMGVGIIIVVIILALILYLFRKRQV